MLSTSSHDFAILSIDFGLAIPLMLDILSAPPIKPTGFLARSNLQIYVAKLVLDTKMTIIHLNELHRFFDSINA